MGEVVLRVWNSVHGKRPRLISAEIHTRRRLRKEVINN